MKLTTEQIAKINQTLIEKGLVYEDIKLELIDHIATDIEVELENKEYNFDYVFPIVLDKWKGLLMKTSLNIFSNAPKMMIDKISSYSLKQVKFALICCLIFSTLMVAITTINKGEYFFDTLKLLFSGAVIFVFFANFMFLFLIWKSSVKTTYRTFLFCSIPWLIFFCWQSEKFILDTITYRYYANRDFFGQYIYWFGTSLGFFYCLYFIQMANEHFKTIKKYKLI